LVSDVGGDWSRYQSGCSILQATSLGGSCGRRVSKAEVESKVFPVLLYYPELSLTHVHSLETAVSTILMTLENFQGTHI